MFDWATPLLSKGFDGFVYFDLGGVVFEWEQGLENIAKLANKPLAKVKEIFCKYDDAACRGLIDPSELGKVYEKELAFSFGEMDFLSFWVSSFKPISKAHELIHKLISQKIPIGIITNIYKGTYEKALKKSIPDCPYTAVVKSCDYGLIKPDLRLLEIAEKACGFAKSKIYFIDDNQTNVAAATSFGWNATLFEKNRPGRSN